MHMFNTLVIEGIGFGPVEEPGIILPSQNQTPCFMRLLAKVETLMLVNFFPC